MFTRLVTFTLALFLSTAAFAQEVEFGLKAGLATGSLQGENYEFSLDGAEDLFLSLEEGNYGYQFGTYLRIPFGERFGMQTEVTFNSARADFRFDDGSDIRVFRERYNDIDVPLLASWKFGFLRLHAGPVGHFFVSSTSDLRDADGRERVWDSFNLGYALGGAIQIGKISLDVRYDGNFARYGEDFAIGGETFRVDQAPRRWVGTVGYRF